MRLEFERLANGGMLTLTVGRLTVIVLAGGPTGATVTVDYGPDGWAAAEIAEATRS